MEEEWMYRLALTQIKGIGNKRAQALLEYFGEARAVFQADPATLRQVKDIGPHSAAAIAGFKDFSAVHEELAFIRQYHIKPLFITDSDYPRRLLDSSDPPFVLFYKGNAELNADRIISVVGTREPTDYGKQTTRDFIKGLATTGVLIVSGLAFGIDALAHRTALAGNLPTIGVLGHGLNQIYPPENIGLARTMARQNGGLLTEYTKDDTPKDHQFPERNRIVAGLCDALIVVESGLEGGSMVTVSEALKTGKKIYAFPGRATDEKSKGCNALIRDKKARLLDSPQRFIQEMGWTETNKTEQSLPPTTGQPGSSLSDETVKLLDLFHTKDTWFLDELLATSSFSHGQMAMSLLDLEMNGLIRSLPGKMYSLYKPLQ